MERAILGIAADGALLQWNTSTGAAWGIQRDCSEQPCGLFTGSLVDGVPEGRGVLSHGGGAFSHGGATYDGLFINGQRHGRGVESNHSNNELCVGTWERVAFGRACSLATSKAMIGVSYGGVESSVGHGHRRRNSTEASGAWWTAQVDGASPTT